jgi:hypothetical protein
MTRLDRVVLFVNLSAVQLQTLQAALQEVERIFDDCAKDGWFKSILNAGEHKPLHLVPKSGF